MYPSTFLPLSILSLSLSPSLVQARNVLVKGDLVGAVDMDLDEIVKAIGRLEVSPLSGERIWIELLIAN